MSTKISIIEIDLGEINKIISDDIATISGEARKKLESSIQERKAIENIKTKRAEQKEQASTKLNNALTSAYNKLVFAGKNGIPANDLLEEIKGEITTAPAFTLRMKTMLRENGNQYRIIRKNIDKIPHYILEPFNKLE